MKKILLATISLMIVPCVFSQEIKKETTVEETEFGWVETTVTQDKFKVETNYFFDNWFISAGLGTEYYLGDNEKHMHFKDRLTPTLDFSVGKWFSPGLGLQLSYSGYKIKGVWADHYAGQNWKTDKEYDNPKNYEGKGKLYKQRANFFNIHTEALLNLNNIFAGYKEKRVYSCIPYVGVGWMRSYSHAGKNVDDITFNAGIINKFRLSNAFDLNVTVRGGIVTDSFDGEVSGNYYMGPAEQEPEEFKGGGQNYDFDGYFGMTIGLTYKFNKRGWDKARSVKTVYSNEKEVARLKRELERMEEELRNIPVVVEKEEIVITFPYLVNFVIDKVKVVNRERVNLGFVADMMKAFPDKKYLVCGYADKYTGTVKRNMWLAENRANNVAKILTEEFGVPAEQLVVDHRGGVDNMFYNDPQVSRSVVITEFNHEK